ncbi:hypothetical protein AtNW77_Chr5g0116401 [Arabidopsis thaliana]
MTRFVFSLFFLLIPIYFVIIETDHHNYLIFELFGLFQNNRVDATIPQGNYHNPFRPFLKPGTWIHISDFRVVVPQSRVRYSSFRFHIKFIWETSVYPLPELVKRDFFDFIFPIDLKYPCLEDWDYVTDAMSVVTNISAIKKFPFVCRQGETDYESRYVSFELLDNM